ncbi:unnamed protein product [Cyprideis torosa]|uniref:Uncharacterized protein n=1 Tax=Cyprideis torosa TaxID=163714 RepID=A0A7R8W0C2_9CRUS|nr:unnamed protein product [Cyprideis torosa]CAG0879588.1 unnamed protein product [Cyprideis torosa]
MSRHPPENHLPLFTPEEGKQTDSDLQAMEHRGREASDNEAVDVGDDRSCSSDGSRKTDEMEYPLPKDDADRHATVAEKPFQALKNIAVYTPHRNFWSISSVETGMFHLCAIDCAKEQQ